MNELTLIPGLLLPWITGTTILAGLGWRRFEVGRPYLLAGYGFFLGYALLGMLVWCSSVFTGGAGPLPIALLLAVVAAVFAWSGLRTQRRGPDRPPKTGVTGAAGGWSAVLLTVLGAWLLAHLVFALLEIVTTPLFPWDAMTVWVYRAKAWFLYGGVFDFMPLEEWLAAGPEITYTVPATDYPLLPSIIPYWAALWMGQWHEALINVPAWLCGLAIVLGFHGQCRSMGLPPLPATAFSYLLASTPLFGVHMSLAGYADIWLAGFAGLAFIALLRGLPGRQMDQSLLGFALLLMGLMVKDEGVVWLLVGVMLFVAMSLPVRWLLGAALAAGLVLAVLALSGWTWFELPVIGAVGYRDGVLYLPLANPHAVEVHAVGVAYLRNTLQLGSWNLSWVLLSVAFLVAVFNPPGRERRVVLAFLLSFAASQGAIFVFTEAGAWAEDSTAINRLPLQVFPALLFAAAMMFHRHRGRPASVGEARAFRRLGVAVPALAAGVVLAGSVAWLQLNQPDEPPAKIRLEPAELETVVGDARWVTDGLVVDGYANGLVLLSSGPVDVDAGSHFLLRIDLQSDPGLIWPDQAPAFFWRTREDPGVVSRITLWESRLVDLSESAEWRGEISEVGLLFPEHDGHPAVLKGLTLEGWSLGAVIELLPRKWFEFEPWSQRSLNVLYGGAPDQGLTLNLLVAAWVVSALVLLTLVRAHLAGRLASWLALTMFIGWLMLDVRWTANRVRQVGLTWTALTTMTVSERITGSYLGRYHHWTQRVRDQLIGVEPSRVLLVRDPEEYAFYGWYAKYQLLPHAVAQQPVLGNSARLANLDYVMFLGPFNAGGDSRPAVRERLERLPMSNDWVTRLQPVAMSAEGILFRVER